MIEKILDDVLSMLLIGKRRSGKSFLLVEMLNSAYFKKRFKHVFLFSPTVQLDKTWRSLNNKNITFFDTFKEEEIQDILEMQKLIHEDDRQEILIILDDFSERLKAKHNSILNKLATKGRHFKASYIFTSQKYNSVPTIIRNNSDQLIFFQISNNLEFKTIVDENSNRNLKVSFEDLLSYSTNEYNYLLVVKGKVNKYYKGNLLKYTLLKTF